jgi:hypothetical protein
MQCIVTGIQTVSRITAPSKYVHFSPPFGTLDEMLWEGQPDKRKKMLICYGSLMTMSLNGCQVTKQQWSYIASAL